MALMGMREYARHRGVTLGAVQKAIKADRISVDDNKKIDSDRADSDWDRNTDASRLAMTTSTIQPALPLVNAAPQSQQTLLVDNDPDDLEEDEVGGKGNGDANLSEYRAHRATRERYQALRLQREYEQQIGNLIDVNEAKRIVSTSFRALRDSVLNVATRIKDELAAISDPAMIEQILDRELGAALAGIDVKQLLEEQDTED